MPCLASRYLALVGRSFGRSVGLVDHSFRLGTQDGRMAWLGLIVGVRSPWMNGWMDVKAEWREMYGWMDVGQKGRKEKEKEGKDQCRGNERAVKFACILYMYITYITECIIPQFVVDNPPPPTSVVIQVSRNKNR